MRRLLRARHAPPAGVGRWVLKRNLLGRVYAGLIASNGEPLCWTEPYYSRSDALKAVDTIRRVAAQATVDAREPE